MSILDDIEDGKFIVGRLLKWMGGALLALFLFIFVISLFNCVQSVPQGYRGVVTQFGKQISEEQEGLVFLKPLWIQKLRLFNIQLETVDITDAMALTIETQEVHADLTVRYANDPDKVGFIYGNISRDGNLNPYINKDVHEVFRAVVAEYNAPDLIIKRQEVSAKIQAAIATKIKTYGAHVVDVAMTNFGFSKVYMAATEAKTTQEQHKITAENKVLTVKAEQQELVVKAQAAADAKRIEADGEYYKQIKAAEAEANSLKLKQQALTANPLVLELNRIQVADKWASRWDGKVPDNVVLSGDSKGFFPFLDMTQPRTSSQK